jgi:choline dehydrogenase
MDVQKHTPLLCSRYQIHHGRSKQHDTQDFISGNLLGAQIAAVSIRPDQTRASSQTTYLDAALASGRTNLKIYTHSLAKRVLFSSNKTATGVEVVSGISDLYILSARSEVIVSAGAFQSPQLLMVSGIGPKEQLEITTLRS